MVSLAANLPFFSGLTGWVPPLFLGAVAGIGLALAGLGFLTQMTMAMFSQVVARCLLSLLVGTMLFFLYMAVVPNALMPALLAVFPLSAIVFVVLGSRKGREGREPFGAYARSIGRGQMKGMFEHRAFGLFVFISGFLFGYCYNIYPKSTRFAGAYADVMFGLVSPAATAFLAVCLLAIGSLVVAGKLAKAKSPYVFGCLLLVALALLYFNLPNMPNNWILFVLLDSAAVSMALFALSGIVARCSLGDEAGFRKEVLVFAIGMTAGAFLAALFIETTVPDPVIQLPLLLRDAIIVGTPAIGFISAALVFFLVAQTMFFPAAIAGQPDMADLSDLAEASKVISRRFALTPREEEILEKLLQGRSGPYISEDLYLSKSTVKTHIRHIYEKTGVTSRQRLIDLAHDVRRELLR